jgi:hypothetical protein
LGSARSADQALGAGAQARARCDRPSGDDARRSQGAPIRGRRRRAAQASRDVEAVVELGEFLAALLCGLLWVGAVAVVDRAVERLQRTAKGHHQIVGPFSAQGVAQAQCEIAVSLDQVAGKPLGLGLGLRLFDLALLGGFLRLLLALLARFAATLGGLGCAGFLR